MAESVYSGDLADTHTYFTGKASGYDRYRPAYPEAAIELVLRDVPRDGTIVDVGCGTGIATRLLAAHGHRVIGIDANPDMIAQAEQASRKFTNVEFRIAPAESLPLPDASVDAIVCAQAFHWFDGDEALPEFRRIARSDARLCLMWNVRTDPAPASAEYCRIMDRAQDEAEAAGRVLRRTRSSDPAYGGWFMGTVQHNFPNVIDYDRDELLGRARSASYYPDAGRLREQFDQALERLFDRFNEGGQVSIHYECCVFTAVRAT